MKGKENYVDEKIYDDDLNQISKNANDGGGFRDDIQAAESITALRPIFLDDTANQWKYSDANDTARLQFDGFALEAGSANTAMAVQLSGIVRGLSSLDIGKKYYVQDDGTIGTTQGTYKILVGIAISTTELLIIKLDLRKSFAIGLAQLFCSSDGSSNVTEADYTLKKSILLKRGGRIRVKHTSNKGDGNGITSRIYVNNVAYGSEHANTGGETEYTDDVEVDTGDRVQLYVKTVFVSGTSPTIKNFRIYVDEFDGYTVVQA